ncbi:MAG TPA: phage integrase N-terminal SAM-like domain-containing protein [Syntrophomonadaceae bacterium]|nr:phage integrase N-terminal SAM-like domain-containing protein [Syntrophomonadaceae bacterium]
MNYRLCFASYLHRQNKSPGTIKHYSRALANFLAYSRSNNRRVSVAQYLHPERLEAYKDYLINNRCLRPSTINGCLTALSSFARFLLGKGILDYNPLELVPRVQKNSLSIPRAQASWDAVQELRREVHQDPLVLPGRVIIELLYAGLTVRELRTIHRNNRIDIDTLLVNERRVQLDPQAQLSLEHYKALRHIQIGDYLVVGTGANGSLKLSEVYGVVKRFSKIIGTRITVRDLRLAQFAMAQSAISPASQIHEEEAA